MTTHGTDIERLIDDGQAAEAWARSQARGRQTRLASRLRGVFSNRRDIRTAEARFVDALRSGSPAAKLLLAELYERQGRHDFALGIARQAAEQGYSPAHYRIGRYYSTGRGAPRSREAARTCMERAAQRGHLYARWDVAMRMIRGEYGITSVVTGLADFLVVGYAIVRETWSNPASRLLAR